MPKRDLASTLQVLFQTKRLKIAGSLPEAQTLIDGLLNSQVGGECEGSVIVNVSHDQSSEDCPAIDSGQNYDATEVN